jgi:hypothetical protein
MHEKTPGTERAPGVNCRRPRVRNEPRGRIGELVDWWIGGLVDWWIGGLANWQISTTVNF